MAWSVGDRIYGGYVENNRLDGLFSPKIDLPKEETSILSLMFRYSMEDGPKEDPLSYSRGCLVGTWDSLSLRIRTDNHTDWTSINGDPSYGSHVGGSASLQALHLEILKS